MANIGDNLSNYPFLDVFSARSAEELKGMLLGIRLPHKIVTIYGEGGRHYAWVSLTRPVKKRAASAADKGE